MGEKEEEKERKKKEEKSESEISRLNFVIPFLYLGHLTLDIIKEKGRKKLKRIVCLLSCGHTAELSCNLKKNSRFQKFGIKT